MLLERDPELARIAAALRDAAAGTGSVVLIEGQGGIGKTSLLDEAERLAGEGGLTVLSARARELERDVAFGVALQLVQPILDSAEDRAAALQGAASLVAPVLERGAVGDEEPRALLHGMFWLLANLAESRPVALLLDDAHLADALSLRFLIYLAQRVDELPMAVLVAARPAETRRGTDAVVALRAHPATTALVPAPLSLAAVERLLVGRGLSGAGEALVEACAEVTAGNPLYLTELLRVLRTSDEEPTVELVRRVGPRAVAEAVLDALGRHPPEATRFARALAVLGDGAAVRYAARLAGESEAEATRQLSVLAGIGLLADAASPAFAHPIVRQAILDDLAPADRAAAHAAAARLLAEASEPAEHVAAHLVETEAVGERWAFDALELAARRAMATGDGEGAARLLRRALDEPSDEPARGRVLTALAGALAAVGDVQGAEAHLDDALAALADPADRARALLDAGRRLHFAGRFGDAVRAFSRALDEPFGDPELKAELQTSRAQASLWDPEGGTGALEEAVRTLRAIEEPTTPNERAALAALAGASVLRGDDLEGTLDIARRAWGDGALLDELGPEHPGLYTVGPAFGFAAEHDLADAVFLGAVREARRRGSVLAFASGMFGHGATSMYRGNVSDAVSALESALDAQRYGWGQFATGGLWVYVRSLIARGDLETAGRALDLPPERERALAEGQNFSALLSARGYLHMAHGDAASALPLFREAGRRALAMGAFNPVFFAWRPGLVAALIALGQQSEARAVAEEEVALARRWTDTCLGWSTRDLALTHDGARRVELLEEASALLGASPARLEHALTLLFLGAAHFVEGRPGDARTHLRRALDIADNGGAYALAERARAGLVAAGGRPRRARTTGPAALTPAELRVARMAAEGRTNREIAEDLFVTPKAVRFHLGNAYKKLGIAGREDLAAALGVSEPAAHAA